MVKNIAHKIHIKFMEHMESVEVHRKLLTFSDDPSVL